MKYLFDDYNKIERGLKNKDLFIFLDYDGTLTPIVNKPQDAFLGAQTARLIEKLKIKYKGRLAIISGRPLKQIKKLVGVKGVIYAGNHGLEIEDGKTKFKAAVPAGYKNSLKEIKKKLSGKVNRVKGAFLEDKGLTVSVHYRLVKAGQPALTKSLEDILHPYVAGKKIKVNHGKKVVEIKPTVLWHKGSAVLWILKGKAMKNIMPVYIGDDTTDEDAFIVLKRRGLTARVGKSKKSEAEYYLKNTEEVIIFLNKILKINPVRKPLSNGVKEGSHAVKNSERAV